MDINWMKVLIAVGILLAVAAVLGILLAIASKYLQLKNERRKKYGN